MVSNSDSVISINGQIISKFDIEDLNKYAKNFSMLVSAKRRTGKSVLCHDFLFHMKDWGFDKVILISESAKSGQVAYNPIDPRLMYNKLSDDLLESIWYNQEKDRQQKSDHKILVIMDDVIGDMKKVKGLKNLGRFATLGRHNGISYIAICQYYKSFPKVFRDNSDVIIFFITTCEEDRKEVLERFCSVRSGIESKREAHVAFQKITSEPYRALVIRNYLTQATNLSDVMSWYKAEPIESFPDYKLYHDDEVENNKVLKVIRNGMNFKLQPKRKINTRLPFM